MMTVADWRRRLDEWTRQYSIVKTYPVASSEEILSAGNAVGGICTELLTFYSATNGLDIDSYCILPVESKVGKKRTWDGIRRANSAENSRFLLRDRNLQETFLVFASIGGWHCAAYHRKKQNIWYEDDDALHETVNSLEEFIHLLILEQTEQ